MGDSVSNGLSILFRSCFEGSTGPDVDIDIIYDADEITCMKVKRSAIRHGIFPARSRAVLDYVEALVRYAEMLKVQHGRSSFLP